MANIGDQLLQPEEGWQRIDSNHSKIRYIGSWTGYTNSSQYNSTSYYTSDKDSYISFVFYGTKIRILSISDNQRPNCKIEIDDVVENYSAYDSTLLFQVINYEKQDLDRGYHRVKIYIDEESSGYLDLDAIDIDDDGYIAAQLGDKITKPEPGMQRIDDTSPYIIYSDDILITNNSSHANGTVHYTTSPNKGSAKIYFYSTRIMIIAPIGAQYRGTDEKVILDGEEFVINTASMHNSTQYMSLIFKKEGLSNSVHVLELIGSSDGQFPFMLDSIDIDEDGYMIAHVGQQLSEPQKGWQRIDNADSRIKYTGSWIEDNSSAGNYLNTTKLTATKDDYYTFKFKGTQFRIISAKNSDHSESIIVNIDGIDYTYSEKGTSLERIVLVFESSTLRNAAHSVIVTNNSSSYIGLDAIDINEDGCILTDEEYEAMINRHLIKSNDRYYTIEESSLVEITEEITQDLISDRGISANILTQNQNILPDKFKLISRNDNTFNINGIESKKELVVASNDFHTAIQSNIDYFDIVGIVDTGTSIKVVFSIDEGVTWKTYDTEFKDLEVSIPIKPYSELSEEELIKWDEARDIILEQGIDIANLSKIDFNILSMEKIRFAYVLSINSKDDKCCTSQLKWQFDSKGTVKSMSSDELEIELLQDSIKVTPKVNSEMIKVNFTNGAGSDNDNIETNIDDNSISKDKTWSSEKINDILNTNTNRFIKVIEESEFQDITEGENEGFFKVNINHGLNCSVSDLVVLKVLNEDGNSFDLGVFLENINQNDFDLISYAKQKMTIIITKMDS